MDTLKELMTSGGKNKRFYGGTYYYLWELWKVKKFTEVLCGGF